MKLFDAMKEMFTIVFRGPVIGQVYSLADIQAMGDIGELMFVYRDTQQLVPYAKLREIVVACGLGSQWVFDRDLNDDTYIFTKKG